MDDEKLHVVAAPGSGKTILGLEVVGRLNSPTLVLAPTIAIRDQWVQRLVEYFLPEGSTVPNWVSKDIRNPRFFTVATYQALHSAFNEGETDEDNGDNDDNATSDKDVNALNILGEQPSGPSLSINEFVATLKGAGIRTVVLDEAHHLRSAWWKSLIKIVDSLENVKIIALTATPPYDVPDFEWQRYVDLCGPVDAEIPIPELVKVGDLCPHQDLVVLSTPSKRENKEIKTFRKSVDEFVKQLKQNDEFAKTVFSHPWIVSPDLYEEEILEDPEFYSSMLIFLNAVNYPLTKESIKMVADSARSIPKLNLEWLEILLKGFLFPPGESRSYHLPLVLEEIKSELKKIGAIERRRITLRKNKRIERLLKQSISKLDNIVKIVEVELEALGPELRMVILTDYIRKDALPRSPDELTPLNKMGVCTIFEAVRRKNIPDLKLGILSGSVVVVPESAVDAVRRFAYEVGVDPINLNITGLPFSDRFFQVRVSGSDQSKIVQLMTKVFNSGAVNVLVGTTSLLGEGWDAPSINSLVIASFVGSYMLSNQMRGRAIRTQPGNPTKTANIWHLVCVETGDDPGEDYALMTRRFKAFVGISFEELIIENGIDRLGLPKPSISKREIEGSNKRMFEFARDREGIRERWNDALVMGDEYELVEEIQTHKMSLPRGFVLYNTIAALFWQGVFLGLYILIEYLRAIRVALAGYLLFYVQFGILLVLIVMAPFLLKALWLFIRHGPVRSSLKQIGRALLATLYFADEIRTDRSNLEIVVEDYEKHTGFVFCHLKGGSSREKWVYLEALQELLGPIENPRYLLVRKSRLLFFQRVDYHPVPKIIGVRKKYAEYFAQMWRKYVGKMDLVYTRRKEGRKILIHARNHSLSAAFVPRSKRRTRWK